MTKEERNDLFWIVVIFVLIGAVLCSCSSSRKVIDNSINKADSVYSVRIDSVAVDNNSITSDSVVETTIVYVTLDSIGNEVSRKEYHDIYHANKVEKQKEKLVTKIDTCYIDRIVEKTVNKEIAKPTNILSVWQFIAGLIIIVFILGLFYLLSKKIRNWLV